MLGADFLTDVRRAEAMRSQEEKTALLAGLGEVASIRQGLHQITGTKLPELSLGRIRESS
jgi:hypothetical protein